MAHRRREPRRPNHLLPAQLPPGRSLVRFTSPRDIRVLQFTLRVLDTGREHAGAVAPANLPLDALLGDRPLGVYGPILTSNGAAGRPALFQRQYLGTST